MNRCLRPINAFKKARTGAISRLGTRVFSRGFSEVQKESDGYCCPEADDANSIARRFRECSNDVIFMMSIQGEYGARKERLIREVMRVDGISWAQARAKVVKWNKESGGSSTLLSLPYHAGMTAGIIGAASSLPMVFHRPTALWFNERFVNEDLPEGGMEALDNIWKVGNWTWGWMEPYLGTASFVLLGLQFARGNMQRLNWRPYQDALSTWRANCAADLNPHYDRQIVRDFFKSDPWQE